ncbi:MAG: hypothetical protein NTW21_30780 [Verrucomicrobia bacterium]|nr:hypothetical protein [Verrucomicrobiota bacterium]
MISSTHRMQTVTTVLIPGCATRALYSAAAETDKTPESRSSAPERFPSPVPKQTFSLAQHLTLGPDQRLRIEPVAAVASLRGPRQSAAQTVLPANQEIVLDSIKGDTMELDVDFTQPANISNI